MVLKYKKLFLWYLCCKLLFKEISWGPCFGKSNIHNYSFWKSSFTSQRIRNVQSSPLADSNLQVLPSESWLNTRYCSRRSDIEARSAPCRRHMLSASSQVVVFFLIKKQLSLYDTHPFGQYPSTTKLKHKVLEFDIKTCLKEHLKVKLQYIKQNQKMRYLLIFVFHLILSQNPMYQLLQTKET